MLSVTLSLLSQVVPNVGGELCNSYPNRLFIPECELGPEGLEPPELLCPLTLTTPSPLNLASPSMVPGGSAPSFSSVVLGATSASVSVNGHPGSSPSLRKGSLPGRDWIWFVCMWCSLLICFMIRDENIPQICRFMRFSNQDSQKEVGYFHKITSNELMD